MRKALRISAIVLGSLLLLLLLAIVWLTTDSGKNFVRLRTIAFLEKKLKTEVYIGSLDYTLPKMMELKEVYFKDQRKDTLLAARRMRVDIAMFKLLVNKVEVEEIQIEGGVSHLYRMAPDTSFNFDYVVKAFASPPNAQAQDAPTDTTGQLQLDIRRLMLKDVFVRYDDYTGGDRFFFDIDTFNARVSKIDPYSMDYRIDTLYIDGLRSAFMMDTSYLPQKKKDSATASGGRLPYFAVKELNLREIVFRFENNNDDLFFDLNIRKLFSHPRLIDLNDQRIIVGDFTLDTTFITLSMGRKAKAQAKKLVQDDPAPQKKWRISADSLALTDVNFKMDDRTKAWAGYGMDYAHMNIEDVDMIAVGGNYTTDTISGNILHLSARERSSFEIRELRTNFMYHPQGVYLRNLYLETSRSVIRDQIVVYFPSAQAISNRPQSVQFRTELKNSIIGVQDVLVFAPRLRSFPLFAKYNTDRVRVNAVVTGFLDALDIRTLQLQGFGDSYLDVSGRINGLPDPDGLTYNLDIARLRSNETVISSFIPASQLRQIDLPGSFSVTGKIHGTTTNINTDLVASTSDGDATVKGLLVLGRGKGRERYDLRIQTNQLNIGKIAKRQDILGAITADVYARGQSFDINYMNAMLRGDIQYASFMGYGYRSINFNANIANKAADLVVNSADPNARLKMDGKVSFGSRYPAIVARLEVEHANPYALKLSKENFQFSGNIDADIPVLNLDYPRGTVIANRPAIVINGQRYILDSMYVSAEPSVDSGNYIVVHTDAIDAVLSGHVPLTKIGSIVQSHINRHYSTNRQDSIRAIRLAPSSYDLQISAVVSDDPLLRVLLPGLEYIDTTRVEASITPDNLLVEASIPSLRYNNMTLQNGRATITGDNTGLNYDIALDRFTQNNNIEFWYATAKGNIARQTITSRVSIADANRTERFGAGFVYHQHGNMQEFHVDEGLVLNYKTWQVSQPNAIVFSPAGFYAQNFRISSGNESIVINSTSPSFTAPMNIAFNNFLASNVSEIFSKDTLLFNGIINGSITLQEWKTDPRLTGNLQVNDLSVKGDTIGDVNALLNSATANAIDARVAITGRGNDIELNGFFYPKPVNGNNFDLTASINTLNVRSFEGLTMNQLKNSAGNIRGNLQIRGTIAQPIVTGELRTDSLTTTFARIGARLSMPAERIVITPQGIEFDNFRIMDETGNSGLVSGIIYTEDMSNMRMDLNVQADHLQVMNTTVQDNELFYGKLLVSTNLTIGGTTRAPEVDGFLTVHDSTKVTVTVPETRAQFQDREGIVEFIDRDSPGRYRYVPQDTTPKLALGAGADLNVNVTIEPEAEFSIIVDQGTGDFLRVKGEAALNTTVNPDGSIGLAGVYSLREGAYELNYHFIKRRFAIQSGSTITFAGDPLEAELDIQAIYTANVAPYDLVEKQVSEPAQLIYYKQRLPFQVHLNLQGEALQPEITFDVVLPEERGYGLAPDITALVQAKLLQMRNNTAELNKQVFAVLLLNRFVSDNPFETGTGIDPGFIARQSVSRFIGEQLNNIAREFIPGMDLTLDLQATEDYTTGQRRKRTDLSVTASRRLLNDRLLVTVGNNFELGGQNNYRNESSTLVPGNIALDYELSRTGRYKVRIYRRNELEDLIRGYVTETGASFILTAEYNRFRNLFINRKKQLRIMREEESKRTGVANN